jgi:hypothetical protein
MNTIISALSIYIVIGLLISHIISKQYETKKGKVFAYLCVTPFWIVGLIFPIKPIIQKGTKDAGKVTCSCHGCIEHPTDLV